MKQATKLVDCEAIKKELQDVLPDAVKVLRVWEGLERTDTTTKVYVEITQTSDDDRNPRHFTKVTLGQMKRILGNIVDVEITGDCSIEFGYALPLTSRYLHK